MCKQLLEKVARITLSFIDKNGNMYTSIILIRYLSSIIKYNLRYFESNNIKSCPTWTDSLIL